jgi:hypothetical protein
MAPPKPDYLSALAPSPYKAEYVSTSQLAPEQSQDNFGIAVTALLTLGKLGLKGAQFIKTPQGQALLAKHKKKLNETVESRKKRYLTYKSQWETEKDPKAKKRKKRRMDKEYARWQRLDEKQQLAEMGIVGRGPVLEYRRNLAAAEWEDLSKEWDTADDARKTVIEKRQKILEKKIAKMDPKLQVLYRKAKVAERYSGTPLGADEKSLKKRPLPSKKRQFTSVAAVRNEKINQALVSGVGGLEFKAQSPPGAGRLVRVPFYAAAAANQWVGANGIEEPGDCPVTSLTLTAGQRLQEISLTTRVLDYGMYRILGVQTNWERNPMVTGDLGAGFTLGNMAVSIRNLEVYNGAELFVTEDNQCLPAATFAIFKSSSEGGTVGGGGGVFAQVPSRTYRRRYSRFFSGLRDNPVVGSSSQVSITVQYWMANPMPVGSSVTLPFSCNLVAEMVEDRVFGNPVVPSASARKGAQVKASTSEIGQTLQGKTQLQVRSSGYIVDTQSE